MLKIFKQGRRKLLKRDKDNLAKFNGKINAKWWKAIFIKLRNPTRMAVINS